MLYSFVNKLGNTTKKWARYYCRLVKNRLLLFPSAEEELPIRIISVE